VAAARGRGSKGRGRTTSEVTLTLDVPERAWGAVIGKGGETIRNLQQEFGVSVWVPNRDGSDGQNVTVRGEAQAAERCSQRIDEIVKEASAARLGAGGRRSEGRGGRPAGAAAALRLVVDVPAGARGAVIGKGGETLRSLQEEYGVTISVPKQDAPASAAVTVRGEAEAAEKCGKHIEDIVEEMSRLRLEGSAKGRRPDLPCPPTCWLCQTQLESVLALFEHLGSKGHIAKVQAVAEWLQLPAVRHLHEEHGFIIEAVVELLLDFEPPVQRCDGLADEAAAIPPDFEWLRCEDRWLCSWDGQQPGRGFELTQAPPLEELLRRCHPDEGPHVAARALKLPALLPKVRKRSQKMRWPQEPTARLCIGLLLKKGMKLDGLDIICSTSFMHALGGDPGKSKDDFYVQRYQGTVVVVHVPKEKVHSQSDTGHIVEVLLCGSQSHKAGVGHYSCSRLRIGERRVLVCSEVDACDDLGQLAEVKSSKHAGEAVTGRKLSMQIACNGSKHVVACLVDEDAHAVLEVEWVPAHTIFERHRQLHVSQGQRVRLVLDRICGHELLRGGPGEGALGPCCRLSFDARKAPVLERAAEGCGVLPLGMQ